MADIISESELTEHKSESAKKPFLKRLKAAFIVPYKPNPLIASLENQETLENQIIACRKQIYILNDRKSRYLKVAGLLLALSVFFMCVAINLFFSNLQIQHLCIFIRRNH